MIERLILMGIGIVLGWASHDRLAGIWARWHGKIRVVAHRKRERTAKPQPPTKEG